MFVGFPELVPKITGIKTSGNSTSENRTIYNFKAILNCILFLSVQSLKLKNVSFEI